ncbi:DUF2262 domain-containing protein [Brunnivagina elsteri]|uniref:DUF2262 domain-containing protein n=1 Tax=Brunnivagina elsteri CCALA 953 TaxID=987040 RepID=A0A2A2TQ41_9CYAN|nr:DUF2262 domain-containing protein [Calothrix elsteri]PAX60552.1 hypothetical protein CK510_01130 [Calothrix elsteri CCALA 953]
MSEQTIYDEILGELVWNQDDECWTSQVQFTLEHIVNITIDPEDVETGSIILMARKSFSQLQQNEDNIRHLISEQMLGDYNENWNDGEKIDIQDFIDSIKLEDIVFNANGNIQLFYNDGYLFAGHGIMVTIDDTGSYQEAILFG